MSATKPTPHLFSLPQKMYAVSCLTCHPNTDRMVILFERPGEDNHLQGFSISARYINGEFLNVFGETVPIVPAKTLWMEAPYSEGPYYVANVTMNTLMKDKRQYPEFYEPKEAALFVNDMNMASMGNPTYSVANEFGVLVDHEGYLTQYSVPAN